MARAANNSSLIIAHCTLVTGFAKRGLAQLPHGLASPCIWCEFAMVHFSRSKFPRMSMLSNAFTPKGLDNAAQGCRKAATLITRNHGGSTLKALYKLALVGVVQPLQGWSPWIHRLQRAALRLPWAML